MLATQAAVVRPTDDDVYTFLSKSIETMLTRTDVGLARGERGRLYAWYWGYYGRAALDMHKATGEQRFLDLVRDASIRLIAERDDKLGAADDERGRVMPSWGTKYKDGVRANEVTTAGLIALPMCEYAALTGDQEIGAAAIETLAAFIPEREDAGDGAYYFRHLTEDVVEALNHANLYGAALAHCSILDGAPESFAETAVGLHKYFLRFARYEKSGVVSWPYSPAPDSPADLPSEAIWKASATIELPIALREVGLLNDPDLFAGMAANFTENDIVGQGEVPQFIGTDRLLPLGDKLNGSSLPGSLAAWLQMDDPELNEIILSIIKNHPEMFPNGWFGGARTMIMGYAHLRASRQHPPE